MFVCKIAGLGRSCARLNIHVHDEAVKNSIRAKEIEWSAYVSADVFCPFESCAASFHGIFEVQKQTSTSSTAQTPFASPRSSISICSWILFPYQRISQDNIVYRECTSFANLFIVMHCSVTHYFPFLAVPVLPIPTTMAFGNQWSRQAHSTFL